MAIWGPKLFESDCTCDISDEFHDLINSGASPEEAKQVVLTSFSEAFSDQDEKDRARLALADLLHSVGALSENERMNILEYLQHGGDISFWEENAPHLVTRRKNELRRLEKRISTVKSNKVSKPKSKKQLPWEVGQIYALPIQNAPESLINMQNEYILLYFFGETDPINGYRIPLAWAKLTHNGKLPRDAKEFNELPFVQVAHTAMGERFDPFISAETLPKEYVQNYIPDEWGYLREYDMMVYESRGNHPPKTLQLLGSFDGIAPPPYNYRRYKSAIGAAWKYLEENILHNYWLHNLHQALVYKR